MYQLKTRLSLLLFASASIYISSIVYLTVISKCTPANHHNGKSRIQANNETRLNTIIQKGRFPKIFKERVGAIEMGTDIKSPSVKSNTQENQKITVNTGTGSSTSIYNPVSDYATFPCVTGLSLNHHGRPGQCVRTVNVTVLSSTVRDTECVDLNSRGMWEDDLVKIFIDALERIDDVHVIDIGCNIGIYSLAAAMTGKRVLAIDPNIDNLRLLAKSLTLGKFSENVTLIWNALSDTYANVSLKPDRRNIGGFSIIDANTRNFTGNDVTIQTVLLDDLVVLFTNKAVAIKMDVEQFELQVLKGGISFFKNIDVRFVQIEMRFHRSRESGSRIFHLFTNLGFDPFRSCLGYSPLEYVSLTEWPVDVCFIKQNVTMESTLLNNQNKFWTLDSVR